MRSIIIPLVLTVCFNTSNVLAQQTITIEEALQKAQANSILLKKFDKIQMVASKNVGSANRWLNTSINAEVGQINSNYIDNKFSIAQSFVLPQVYKSQKAFLQHEIEHTLFEKEVKWTNIKTEVYQTYFDLIYLQKKKALLQSNDSLMSIIVAKQSKKVTLGESNAMDITMAENQLSSIKYQLNSIAIDIASLNKKMNYLLNDGSSYNPDFRIDKVILIDKNVSVDNNNQSLQAIVHQKHINEALIEVEKSKLLPTVNVGYTNTTFKGNGADNRYYGIGSRFSAINLGVDIPIFRKAQLARIEATKAYNEVLDMAYQEKQLEVQAALETSIEQLKLISESLQVQESSALVNARKMINTATAQLNAGEINFIQWAYIYGQTIDINNNYIETLKKHNDTAIQIIYLTSK